MRENEGERELWKMESERVVLSKRERGRVL
jgi:hypothetical protein